MNKQIKLILSQFQGETDFRSAERIGSGHIHQTWLIETVDKNHPGFILQKFNNHVFPDTGKVMDNILKITTHLRQNSDHGNTYQIAKPVATKSGSYYYSGPDGQNWRLYHRITPGINFDTIPNETVAYEAGKIYGSFIAGLHNFPAATLHEVISGFHSVSFRYSQLQEAIETDPVARTTDVEEEIHFAIDHIDAMREIPELQENGILPLRVTHNDTKLNNVLFDEEDRAVAVVDLDTVMPGYSLYDFGDLVRSAANTAREDSARAEFSLPVFSAIAKGFLEEAGQLLTPKEISLLPLAPQYMAYLMGIRFLADYISGDIYYKINNPKQNLDRSRAQFSLIRSMNELYNKADDIIAGL